MNELLAFIPIESELEVVSPVMDQNLGTGPKVDEGALGALDLAKQIVFLSYLRSWYKIAFTMIN